MKLPNPLNRLARRLRLRESWNRKSGTMSQAVPTEQADSLEHLAASLTRTLSRVLEESWKVRHQSRYHQVKVLLIHWAETDDSSLGVDATAKMLADVFHRRYGFDVQIWLIPSLDQPQQALAAKLSHFVQDSGQAGNLLIFWYGGAARETDDGNGPALWFGETWGGEVNSAIVPQILGSGKADVLTLYDCGNSLHGQSVPGSILFEHLGASASGDTEARGTSLSFTKSLADILDRPEFAACGIPVLDLYRKQVNRSRRQRIVSAHTVDFANTLPQGHAKSNARSCLPHDVLRSPVYCQMSSCLPRSQGGPRSITLSRVGVPLETFAYEYEDEGLQVELKLRLRKNDINVGRWKEWIMNAPPEADQVSLVIT